jgi:Zn-dependent M28 family amino/carboxypeptidase
MPTISDGLGVGVMAEIARVLVERDQHIHGSVIFLFNGAEGK